MVSWVVGKPKNKISFSNDNSNNKQYSFWGGGFKTDLILNFPDVSKVLVMMIFGG